MYLTTLSSIVVAVIVISIFLPWSLIAVAVVSALYAMAAGFCRVSARETKVHALQA
jgi:hypothetical protein